MTGWLQERRLLLPRAAWGGDGCRPGRGPAALWLGVTGANSTGPRLSLPSSAGDAGDGRYVPKGRPVAGDVRRAVSSPLASADFYDGSDLGCRAVQGEPDGIGPGERVGITGNLQELGAWGDPIALERSADRADVWQVELELPIGMSETHKRGLFEFRYVIQAANGGGVIVAEGGVSRRHYEMHPVFLHNFKSLIDPDNGRPTVGDRVRLAPGLTSKGSSSLAPSVRSLAG